MAPRVRGCGRPWGGRGRPGHPGRLHRQLAAQPPPHGRHRRQQLRADRPGAVPRPLTQTAQALCAGELSPAHASVLAHGTHDLPTQTAAKAEPVLVAAARRLDPPRLRRVIGHLQHAADPDGADRDTERRHGRRGLWVAPTYEGMVALQGLLEPEAGHLVLAALEPLARPSDAQDARSGPQRRADALVELARRNLEGGQLPKTGGIRPQLTVTVDLDSLLGHPGGLGGELGGLGPLHPEACRGWPAMGP